MSYRVVRADDAFWRPSKQMGVSNADLAKQLAIEEFGARLWRLAPGQAESRHRHPRQSELYVLLQGRGRIRVDDEAITLESLSAIFVEPHALRQLFNDTDDDQLWLVVGAPREQLTREDLAWVFPDGPKALPPELSSPDGGRGRTP